MKKKYYTTGDVSKYCEVDINTVKHWIRGGVLSGFKTPTGHYKITIDAFISFIKEHGFTYDPEYFGDEEGRIDILLIDDDPNFQELLVFNLKRKLKNINIETAKNGFDGYLKLNQIKPKLVLLDLVMPGITGLEFLRVVKLNKKLEGLNIVVISAHLDDHTTKELKELSISNMLSKPLDMDHFIDVCKQFLSK